MIESSSFWDRISNLSTFVFANLESEPIRGEPASEELKLSELNFQS